MLLLCNITVYDSLCAYEKAALLSSTVSTAGSKILAVLTGSLIAGKSLLPQRREVYLLTVVKASSQNLCRGHLGTM